jgi:hypothetical protein
MRLGLSYKRQTRKNYKAKFSIIKNKKNKTMKTKSCTINNWKKLIRDYKINEEKEQWKKWGPEFEKKWIKRTK